MYSHGNYDSYRIDGNCSIIQGWAKYLPAIGSNTIPQKWPVPTLAMFHISQIISSCVGIKDIQNPIPHSCIFYLQGNDQMIELLEKEGNFIQYTEDSDDDNKHDRDGSEKMMIEMTAMMMRMRMRMMKEPAG